MVQRDVVEDLKARAEASLQQGDLKGAQRDYRALLLQRLDGDSPITQAQVFMHLGEVHLRMGEPRKAEQMLRRAVAADPKLARATELLAQVEPSGSADLFGTPEERFARAPVMRALKAVAVAGLLVVVGAQLMSGTRWSEAEAIRRGEILACGKPGCAIRRAGGKRDWIEEWFDDTMRTQFTYWFQRENPPGTAVTTRARIACPPKYLFVGVPECRIIEQFDERVESPP